MVTEETLEDAKSRVAEIKNRPVDIDTVEDLAVGVLDLAQLSEHLDTGRFVVTAIAAFETYAEKRGWTPEVVFQALLMMAVALHQLKQELHQLKQEGD